MFINHRDNRAMLSICALSLSLSLAGCGSGDVGSGSPTALAQADTASAQNVPVSFAVTGAADEKAVNTDWTARVRDFIAKMRLEQVVSTGTATKPILTKVGSMPIERPMPAQTPSSFFSRVLRRKGGRGIGEIL